jgi:hypothetical protein
MLLAACNGDDDTRPPPGGDGGVIETPDSGTPDSGTPDSGTPDSGTFNPGPATVQGRGEFHYIDPTAGIVTAPRDLSDRPIAALIPDATGTTYTVKPATLAPSNDAFTIDNVTAPYLLKFGTTYSWFTGRTAGTFTPDLGFPQIRRREVTEAGPGTALALNVTGLAPWQGELDDLQVSAPYAGLRYFSLPTCDSTFAATAPAEGATSYSKTYDWTRAPVTPCGNDPFLIEASKGDDVYITQLVGRRASNAQLIIKELKRSYTTVAFNMTDGQSAGINAQLSAQPTTSRSFDMRFDGFRAAAAQVHPNAVLSAMDFGLGTIPAWSTLGESTGFPDLVSGSPQDLNVPNQTLSFEYANPFPAAWGTFMSVRANTLTSYSVPLPEGGEAPALQVRVGVTQAYAVPATQTGAAVIQPLLSPARALKVNGQSATGAPLTGIGTTPLVSWEAPEIGRPSFYRVNLYELRVSATTGRTTATLVSDFFTQSTSLRIPADILASGKHYYLRVIANSSSLWNPDRPFLTQFGEGRATALSSRLSP